MDQQLFLVCCPTLEGVWYQEGLRSQVPCLGAEKRVRHLNASGTDLQPFFPFQLYFIPISKLHGALKSLAFERFFTITYVF